MHFPTVGCINVAIKILNLVGIVMLSHDDIVSDS